MRLNRPTRLHDGGVIILAIIALIGVVAAQLGQTRGVKITENQFFTTVGLYDQGLKGAILFRTACTGDSDGNGTVDTTPILPPSCERTYRQVQAAVTKAKAARVALDPYRTNPPQNLVDDLKFAADLVKALMPPAYFAAVATPN